jgi:hypothetical protein
MIGVVKPAHCDLVLTLVRLRRGGIGGRKVSALPVCTFGSRDHSAALISFGLLRFVGSEKPGTGDRAHRQTDRRAGKRHEVARTGRRLGLHRDDDRPVRMRERRVVPCIASRARCRSCQKPRQRDRKKCLGPQPHDRSPFGFSRRSGPGRTTVRTTVRGTSGRRTRRRARPQGRHPRRSAMPIRKMAFRQRGARFARIRCSVRRCIESRRAVSETLRPHNS